MKKLLSFIRREPVLVISMLAAAVSCFFVPPDKKYIDYIDFRTLALLYALMIVVAGFRKAGVFHSLAQTLCVRAKNIRTIGIMLVFLSFFTSMLITNDVALLTFVPFTVIVLGMAKKKQELMHIIILQTIAANLGSMLTPVGNPQNLYLYSYYKITFTDFISMTFPYWIASLALLLLCCLFLPNSGITAHFEEGSRIDIKSLVCHLILFFICLATVIRILDFRIMLLLVIAILCFLDRKLLFKADFMLLLTFVAFFVFAGNLARIGAVNEFLKNILSGREYLTALMTSQVISNVPAALLLSNFTGSVKALVLGVDIGGLGTPVASLATLISLKLYSGTGDARPAKFVLQFMGMSLIFLVLFSLGFYFL